MVLVTHSSMTSTTEKHLQIQIVFLHTGCRMFTDTATTLKMPVAGTSDQSIGSSFACVCPCGEPSYRNSGGAKCTYCTNKPEPLSCDLLGGGKTNKSKKGRYGVVNMKMT